MVLYLYNICNECNKHIRIYIYKQIRVSLIVSVEFKTANINVKGDNDMFVLFAFK